MNFKKHSTQLTDKEMINLFKRIKNINYEEVSLAYHIYEKLYERLDRCGLRNIDLKGVIRDILNNYDLIEVHNENPNKSVRILLRSVKLYNKYNACLVLDLSHKTAVTLYFNHVKDNHTTLDNSRYYNLEYNFTKLLN